MPPVAEKVIRAVASPLHFTNASAVFTVKLTGCTATTSTLLEAADGQPLASCT